MPEQLGEAFNLLVKAGGLLLTGKKSELRNLFFDAQDLTNVVAEEEVDILSITNPQQQRALIANLLRKYGGGIHDVLADRLETDNKDTKLEFEVVPNMAKLKAQQ